MKANKLKYIIAGLLIGVVVGLAVGTASKRILNTDYILKLKDLLAFHSKDASRVNDENKQIVVSKNDPIQIPLPDRKDSLTLKDTEVTGTLKKVYEESNNNNSINEEINNYITADDDDMIVYRDKIVYSKYIKVKGLAEINNYGIDLLDSVLMNSNRSEEGDLLMIEYWQSPVNYKGYKLSYNKLIVFGVDDYEKSTVKIINGDICFFAGKACYILENTDDFKPLVVSRLYSSIKKKK